MGGPDRQTQGQTREKKAREHLTPYPVSLIPSPFACLCLCVCVSTAWFLQLAPEGLVTANCRSPQPAVTHRGGRDGWRDEGMERWMGTANA